jgi:hypothetical protein
MRCCASGTWERRQPFEKRQAFGLRWAFLLGSMRLPVKKGGAVARPQPLATPDSRVAVIRKGSLALRQNIRRDFIQKGKQ